MGLDFNDGIEPLIVGSMLDRVVSKLSCRWLESIMIEVLIVIPRNLDGGYTSLSAPDTAFPEHPKSGVVRGPMSNLKLERVHDFI